MNPGKKTAKKYDSFVEPFNRALRKIGMKLYPPEAGIEALDVGCGTGTTLNQPKDVRGNSSALNSI